MDDAGATGSQASTVRRVPILLSKGQRWASGLFGAAAGGGGAAAVFLTKNQAGATALLLAGGLGLLMALTGRVPDRIGREGVVHEPIEGPAARALNDVLRDEGLPLEIKAAIAEALQEELGKQRESNRSVQAETTHTRMTWSGLETTATGLIYEQAVISDINNIVLPGGARLAQGLDAWPSVGGRRPVRPDAAIVPMTKGTPPDLSRSIAIDTRIGHPTTISSRIRRLLDAGFGAAIVITPQADSPVNLPANARHIGYGVIEKGALTVRGDELFRLQSEIESLWRQINPSSEMAR